MSSKRFAMRVELAAAVVLLISGCGGSPTPSAAGPSAALPQPFQIVARWSSESLGLLHPRAMAIGPDGNIHVTDDKQHVTVISPEGKVLRRWGGLGSGPGQFQFSNQGSSDDVGLLGKIAIRPNGDVYVTDSGNGRIEIFTPYGGLLRQFQTQGPEPVFLAVDAAGNVYVDDQGPPGLYKYTASGNAVWHITARSTGNPDLRGGLVPGGFDLLHGRLLVANADESLILTFDPDGNELGKFAVKDSLVSGPCESAADSQGYIYIAACGPNESTANYLGGPGADTLVYDQTHKLVAEWPGAPHTALVTAPHFVAGGQAFALAWDGSLVKLKVTLPGR